MATQQFLKHWSGADRKGLDDLLTKRVAELEADPQLLATTDWIITLAGGVPDTMTRRISLLSAIVITQGMS